MTGKRPSKKIPLSHLAGVLFMLAAGSLQSAWCAQDKSPDWHRAARLKPDVKVLVLVEGDRPITLADLASLSDSGFVPADRDPGLVVGLKKAVFSTSIRKWISIGLPRHLHGTLLPSFVMTGVYRVGFKVEAKEYQGPLSLEITAPRDGPGQKLIASEHVVRPSAGLEMREDTSGNRWLLARYASVKYGSVIRFHFAFSYQVNMAELLERDLALIGNATIREVPPEVQPCLRSGYKINPALPAAVTWASAGESGPPDARREYERLGIYLKESVAYDTQKRNDYFSGRAVYADLDTMYQNVSETLSRRLGCCPDTVLLECTFLRARGIPCRTAGRFGHFFTMVYVPERGWVSTSVTPTAIPLIVAPGQDHVPFQKWEPRIPLRTIYWEARIRIEPQED